MKTDFANCSAPLIRLPIWEETQAVSMEDWHLKVLGDVGKEFVVPSGTLTDGASIPRFLWRLCGHPLEAPRVYAALLHDFLYRTGAEPRAVADECYYLLLRHFGIAAWRARIEYYALRMFGGSSYQGE